MSSGPASTTPERREGVVRGTLTVLVTYAGTAGFTAVLTLYLVRALGPHDYGLFSLALGIAGLVALPADFGIAASAARFMAEQRSDRQALAVLWAAATRLKLLVAGTVAVTLFLLAGVVADAYGEPDLVWPVRAIAFASMMHSTFGLFSGMFISVGRTSTNLRMVLSESAMELTATICFVALGAGAGGAALGRFVGYAGGALIGMALAVRLYGRRAAAVHRRGGPQMTTMGRYAVTVWLVSGAYTVFDQLDLIVIGAVLNAAAVGAFSAPLRFTYLLSYAGLAVGNAVSPRVARVEGEEPDVRAVQNGLRVIIVVQALVVAPLLAWADPIVTLALGPDYHESVAVLRWMTPFIFLQGLAPLVSLTVNYLGEAGKRLPWTLAAVAVNLTIDLTLLPVLGVKAAAIGTSVAYALYVGGHLLICRRLLGLRLRPLARTAARAGAACAASALVLAGLGTGDLPWWAWLAGALLGPAVYVGVVLALREVSPEELRALRRRAAAVVGR